MDICMLDPLFFPYFGGSEKVVYEVGKRLAKKGHNITVLTSRLPNTKKEEVLEGINIVRSPALYFEKLPSFMPPPYTVAPLLLKDLLARPEPLFHIHNRYWYYLGVLLAIKLRKRKLMLTLHNARPSGISASTDFAGGIYDDIWGHRIMENCDRIVTVSDWTKRTTVPQRIWERCRVIHNGVDVEKFRPRPKKSAQYIRDKFGIGSEELLLTNARLIKQKGFEYLIEAFAKLKAEKAHKDAKLLIIGKGPLKGQIEADARQRGIGDSVFITTGIPEEELPKYYNAADVFVLSTIWEPCAVVLFEALASGLPIVTSDAGGNCEIVEESCGMRVPSRNPEAMANALREVLEDKRRMNACASCGRARAEKNFSWDVNAAKLEKVYQEIL